MPSRYRLLLTLEETPTGDRRRFAPDSIVSAATPLPLRYVREDTGLHNGAVIVGRIDDVFSEQEKIWGNVTLFDDIDTQKMPHLAEMVAEAQKFMDEKVVGVSVDPDSFDAVFVREGTTEPIENWDDITEDDKLELLVTSARLRAGTLVHIPAFDGTSSGIERIEDDEESDPITEEDVTLLASAGIAQRIPVTTFTSPVSIKEPTPITYDFDNGVVYGHIFQSGVCHIGISDECRMPPTDEDFSHFHIFPVETEEGVVFAGRITVGGTHPDRGLSMHDVHSAYSQKQTVAYVRASVDEHGIFVCGPLERDLNQEALITLSRRKVSGHWPEVNEQGNIALAEVLALSDGPPEESEPGFPVGVTVRHGRLVGLTAALGPSAVQNHTVTVPHAKMDYAAIFRVAYQVMTEEQEKCDRISGLRQQLVNFGSQYAEATRSDLARLLRS